jgi:hypothetical protein
MADKGNWVKSTSSLYDLQHRVLSAVRIGHASLVLGVVNPMAVHDEAVFAAAGCAEQFPGPFAAVNSIERCGAWFPVIKRADQ